MKQNIDVIIITYNRLKFIKGTLDCIFTIAAAYFIVFTTFPMLLVESSFLGRKCCFEYGMRHFYLRKIDFYP